MYSVYTVGCRSVVALTGTAERNILDALSASFLSLYSSTLPVNGSTNQPRGRNHHVQSYRLHL
jgi:hypothetical protein